MRSRKYLKTQTKNLTPLVTSSQLEKTTSKRRTSKSKFKHGQWIRTEMAKGIWSAKLSNHTRLHWRLAEINLRLQGREEEPPKISWVKQHELLKKNQKSSSWHQKDRIQVKALICFTTSFHKKCRLLPGRTTPKMLIRFQNHQGVIKYQLEGISTK